uniref:4-hydroxyphenylacetaldehyde reductase 2 n=1 Tax=Rhodiola rosea TaxID=203015 RepID=A0A2I6B3P7_RHORB|nr:4-hydroxyphenylacetaldehyde reductase 2 [Rhodiola rosea]
MGLSEEKKLVCVTGASGYIASWIVKLLLQRGYTVNATVRSINDTKKVAHLLALDGAKERLNLFEADLIKEGSFDSAIQGCQGVFHTASPVLVNVTDPQAELIDPAVNGTLNVLRSCSEVPSIKRIVVTSSISSVVFNGKPLTPDVVVDESWYSDPVYCKESKLWYKLSKTLAEEASLSFAKEHELDLVTIHPGFVIGPPLQEALNITVELIVNHAKGTQKLGTGYHRFVDVRDVAAAHIQAFEIPAANGRYILVERVTHSSEVTKILRELYPALEFPLEWDDDKPSTSPYLVSKERAKTLGIDFIPVESSIRDTVESLKDK